MTNHHRRPFSFLLRSHFWPVRLHSPRRRRAASTGRASKPRRMEHFQAVLRFDTSDPPGNERPAAEYLKQVLEREGIATKVFELEPNRLNVVARLKGSGKKRPLLLMGHTDTVNVDPAKWTFPPFSATRNGGYVYGRGTVDDKDNVTAALMTMLLLKRSGVALDRDVIFLAEAGEEGTTRVGIQFMVQQHFAEIDAEYCLAEGGSVLRSDGRVRYASVQTAEKIPHGIMLTATGTAGHGSVPLETNSILKLTQAVATVAAWKPPIQLNDTTRTYFTRLAAISPPAEAAQVSRRDRQRSEGGAGRGGLLREGRAAARVDREELDFAEHHPGRLSHQRHSVGSEGDARRAADVGAGSGGVPERGAQGRERSGHPRRVDPRDVRPATPSARLDSEVFKVLESAFARLYDTAVLPTMSTGATDMAYLRAKGHPVLRRRPGARRRGRPEGVRRAQRSGAHSRKRAAQVRAVPLRSGAGSGPCELEQEVRGQETLCSSARFRFALIVSARAQTSPPSPGLERSDGRPGWVLENGKIRVGLLRGGGHIAEVRLVIRQPAAVDQPDVHPRWQRLHGAPRVLSALRSGVADERAQGLSGHGEAGSVEWQQTRPPQTDR